MSREARRDAWAGLGIVALAVVALGGCFDSDRNPISGSSSGGGSASEEAIVSDAKNSGDAQGGRVEGTTEGSDSVLVGAGDIGKCGTTGDEATARLLDGVSGVIFTAGDNAYPSGTASEFSDCYDPSWGRHKSRTYPSVGNNEYETPNASGYFDYFGARAGDPSRGYYSYELGNWHVVVLNSNCSEVSCAMGSRQERWLRSDLAANQTACTLAYWHHPLFSSGGNTREVAPFWDALYAADAEVVVNGHVHAYERFLPQKPDGTIDRERGIREFVVGTGGAGLNPLRYPKPNSSAQASDTHGVLKLILRPSSYEWEFVPVAGKTFTDSGTAGCH